MMNRVQNPLEARSGVGCVEAKLIYEGLILSDGNCNDMTNLMQTLLY
jgi:hypothetical protein